jgi:general secretion pathway protein I
MMRIAAAAASRQRGFSLLEMLVAIAILGLSLGALYQAATGATRNLRTLQRHAYAVELARSLVDDYAVVPAEGLADGGSTASGFRWQVVASPVSLESSAALPAGSLQRLQVQVVWPDGTRERSLRLDSVVAGAVR